MDDTNQTATKKELLERLLDLGKVMISLDARRDDVVVPPQYGDDADLRLNVSYRFQYGDLEIDGDELRATLSFAGSPHTCKVPLEAIFAMVSHVSGEGFFFPIDAPPEALASLAVMVSQDSEEEADGDESRSAASVRASGRPILRAIDGGAGRESDADGERASEEAPTEDEDGDSPQEGAADESRPRGGHLRVVK